MGEATAACMAEVPGYFQCAGNGDETEEAAVWVSRRVLLNWKHELWIAVFCVLENWVRDVRRRFSVDSKGFASVC